MGLVALVAATMLGAIGLAAVSPPHAHTLAGTWQGSVHGRRTVWKIAQDPHGALHGAVYHLGQELAGDTLDGNPVSIIEVRGRHVRFAEYDEDSTFDGDLSADGRTLSGTLVAQGRPQRIRLQRARPGAQWPIDPSPHKVLFVPVDRGVRLEVLDWGGHGPPLVLLAGAGNTAHVFDSFAPGFTGAHHVYAITRRGFGLSSKPPPTDDNYDADRLGDDVLAVIAALGLDRPVLAGHSLAGEELSSIGARHPEQVSGLIYLDAAADYALYTTTGDLRRRDALNTDASTLRRDLLELRSNIPPSRARALIAEMQAALPLLQADLQKAQLLEDGKADPPLPQRPDLRDDIETHLVTGARRYTAIKAPVLAIVADPPACGSACDTPWTQAHQADIAAQTSAFQAALPSARVVRIPHAQHYVFLSNRAEVVREMNAFMDGLHRPVRRGS